MPKQLSQWLLQILPTVWNTLTHSAHVYVACVVNETEEVEQQVDLDGISQLILKKKHYFKYANNLLSYYRRSYQL